MEDYIGSLAQFFKQVECMHKEFVLRDQTSLLQISVPQLTSSVSVIFIYFSFPLFIHKQNRSNNYVSLILPLLLLELIGGCQWFDQKTPTADKHINQSWRIHSYHTKNSSPSTHEWQIHQERNQAHGATHNSLKYI